MCDVYLYMCVDLYIHALFVISIVYNDVGEAFSGRICVMCVCVCAYVCVRVCVCVYLSVPVCVRVYMRRFI